MYMIFMLWKTSPTKKDFDKYQRSEEKYEKVLLLTDPVSYWTSET